MHSGVFAQALKVEDFGHVISTDRRRNSLNRISLLVEKAIETERTADNGVSNWLASKAYEDLHLQKAAIGDPDSQVTCSIIDYLSYTAFKLNRASSSVEKKSPQQSHRLDKYEERTTDRNNLRQTVLRIPTSHFSHNQLKRELGDGQSSAGHSSEHNYSEEEKKARIFRVLYDYSPENDDELTLKAGDRILVDRQISQDWWLGHAFGSETQGLFPTNYIERCI